MAFDFSRLAPMFAGFGGGPGAAFGVHEMQQKQRAGKLGAQARSRFYEKLQAVAPGDVAGLQAAVMAGYHDIQNDPALAAADPDLIPNLLKEANTLKEMMQAPEPQVLSPGSQLIGPNNEVLAQAPFAPEAPSEAEKVAAAIKKATERGDMDAVRLLQAWVPKEAQAPQGTTYQQNIEFHAERLGLDIRDPKQYLEAVESFSEFQRTRQDVFNYPTGYAPTGEMDELGRPVVSPLEGTEPDVQRKAGEEAKQTIVETLDRITRGIESNQSEFGVMSGLKRAGRAAASTVEQLGTAAGQAGVPIAGGAGKAAGAIRRGPLAEGSMTYEDAQVALDELAVLMSRRGGAFSGPEGEALKQAQQEINNTRERLETGKADIPTVLRRLRVVRNLIAGEGFAPGSASQTERSLNLSAEEQRIVDYHRNTIKSGKVGRDPEGRPVTVYSTGIRIKDGPHKGKFVSVPGYVPGKGILTEEQAYNHWKKEIDAGKWPMYSSGEELNKRSQDIHRIMDEEEGAAQSAGGGTPTQPQSTEEGLTATNPQTGERVVWRNGKWEPI